MAKGERVHDPSAVRGRLSEREGETEKSKKRKREREEKENEGWPGEEVTS